MENSVFRKKLKSFARGYMTEQGATSLYYYNLGLEDKLLPVEEESESANVWGAGTGLLVDASILAGTIGLAIQQYNHENPNYFTASAAFWAGAKATSYLVSWGIANYNAYQRDKKLGEKALPVQSSKLS